MANKDVDKPVPLPGTPEYEELYQAALKQLDEVDKPQAAAPAKESSASPLDKDGKPPASKPAPDQKAKKDDGTPDPNAIPEPVAKRISDLETTINGLNQRLKHTREWGTGIVQRFREFQKQIKDSSHGERPQLLSDLDGLEQAIEHVITSKGIKPSELKDGEDGLDFPDDATGGQKYTSEQWVGIVATAIPDIENLLADDKLFSAVEAKKKEMGDNWDNPLMAIAAMTEIKSDYKHQQKLEGAVKTAIETYTKTQQRADDMSLPGGPGSGGQDHLNTKQGDNPEVNDASTWAEKNMSDEEFEKRRQRVLNS